MEKKYISNDGQLNQASKVKTRRARSRWLSVRRFKDSNNGAVAVEFAIVAIPFLLICFAILETSIKFFMGRTLEMSVNTVSRMLKTNQIGQGTTEAEFRNLLCQRAIMNFFECQNPSLMLIDVKEIANWDRPPEPTRDIDGLSGDGFGYAPGPRNSINIVRVYYDWPMFFDWSRLSGDDQVIKPLTAKSAFLIEP